MVKYWLVKVELKFENEKGKIQKVTENILVDAVSATEAEALTYKEYEGENDFSVKSVVQSKILKVI